MTRGRELPVNSKVRRRLFSEDEPPPKTTSSWNGQDYLSGIIKAEYIARNLKNELILKGMKWNFDFENEEPMEGPFQWYRKEITGEWVGMKASGRTFNMRKRKVDPNSDTKSVYEDDTSKVRRLPSHTVVQRPGFFNDDRALGNTINQGEDNDTTNGFMDDTSPIHNEGIHCSFDYDNRVPLDGPEHWHLVGEDWVGQRPGLPSNIIIYPNNRPQVNNINMMCEDTISLGSGNASKSDFNSSFDINDDDSTASDVNNKKLDNVTKNKEIGDEFEEDDETENEDKIDERDIIEKVKAVNDAKNNAIENVGVATDDSYMVIDLKNEIIELGKDGNDSSALIPEDNFEDLRIMEGQDLNEKQNYMKEKNEVTPRNEREERMVPVFPKRKAESKPRLLSDKAKKRLYNQHFY